MLVIFKQILILFAFVLSGYILCKKNMINSSHSRLLSVLTVNIFLPCKIFSTFSANLTVTYIQQKYSLFIIAFFILLILLLFAELLSRSFSNVPYEQRMYWHALIVPNISYFGYVLADNLYGPEILLNVMVFSLPILIFNYSLGYCTLTKTSLRLNCLLKPTIFAIILGSIFGLFSIPIPDIITDLTQKASACVGPCSMILTGMVISEYQLKKLLQNYKAYIIAVLRLIIVPAIIAGIMSIFFDNNIVLAVLLVYAMPCPMNTIVFSRIADENCEIGAEMVFISTIACIITIPLSIQIFT